MGQDVARYHMVLGTVSNPPLTISLRVLKTKLLQAGCPSCHQTNGIKALMFVVKDINEGPTSNMHNALVTELQSRV